MRKHFRFGIFLMPTLFLTSLPGIAYAQSGPVNLTGTWISKMTKFEINSAGCRAGYSGLITIDSKNLDEGMDLKIEQNAGQIKIPDKVVRWSNNGVSGSYTWTSEGNVSGQKLSLVFSGDIQGRFTNEYIGTISPDGNTVAGKILCRTTRGPATAEGTFTWTKKAGTDYTALKPTPARDGLNPGLTSPSPNYVKSVLGIPGELTNDCTPVTNPVFKKLIVTERVGPFRVTGLKPAVSAIRRVFDQVKLEKPDLYEQLGTEGMLCVRKVRGGSDFSNHSWGTAIDIKINKKLDTRGDRQTQVGLSELYPYFQAEKFYWGAAFGTEDSMHFEVSQQLLEEWKASGEIP
jgi:D-alanyl-D-alanine carboxypeptidase